MIKNYVDVFNKNHVSNRNFFNDNNHQKMSHYILTFTSFNPYSLLIFLSLNRFTKEIDHRIFLPYYFLLIAYYHEK